MKSMISVAVALSGYCLVGAGIVDIAVYLYLRFVSAIQFHDTYYTFRFGPLSFTPPGTWGVLFMIALSVAEDVCGVLLLRWAWTLRH